MKFDAPQFRDEKAARQYIEALRWPAGRVCGKCGSFKSYETKKEGRYRCAEKECRKDFTVTTGTVMESSHIRLTIWVTAFYMMASSKKGVSAHQLHRTLEVTYKTAWFLAHRIRAAMASGGLLGPIGGEGKVVEADETYFGKAEGPRPTTTTVGRPFTRGGRSGPSGKRPIVALVERGGSVRAFHVAVATKVNVQQIVRENVDPASRLHTDESRLCTGMGAEMAAHETVKHAAGEYVRGDVHNNTAEAFFGLFKRGMRGTYQHCAEKHLHRYVTEFEFRFNTRTKVGVSDEQRARLALKGIEGKRLTYRRTDGAGVQA
ncbi:MAG: IS1595 family transposase [Alphaproteobacteria bacterium]|nr:IS1595 family transposase [Alphaproteobacteria bacterium]